MIKKLLLSLGILSSLTGFSQVGGTSVYSFLNVTPSARISGLSGLHLAHPDADVSFGFVNPSLLNPEYSGQLGFHYVALAADVSLGEVAYAHDFKKYGTFMAGFKYAYYGDFQRTLVNSQVVGQFTAADYMFQIGWGYALDTNWNVGANMKLINGAYAEFSSWGMAFDLAATYRIPNTQIIMSMMAKNVGYQVTPFSNSTETLPFDLQYSISQRFKHVPLRWGIHLEKLHQWDLTYDDPNAYTRDFVTGELVYNEPNFWNKLIRHVALSAELSPSDKFYLNVGYHFRQQLEMAIPTRRSSAGLSFGLGFKLYKFKLGYSNTNMNVAGRMHHISVTTRLGDF
ncbi:MAG: hypothetical protein SchgKO_18160 [Schleiferiaceae bacterium]